MARLSATSRPEAQAPWIAQLGGVRRRAPRRPPRGSRHATPRPRWPRWPAPARAAAAPSEVALEPPESPDAPSPAEPVRRAPASHETTPREPEPASAHTSGARAGSTPAPRPPWQPRHPSDPHATRPARHAPARGAVRSRRVGCVRAAGRAHPDRARGAALPPAPAPRHDVRRSRPCSLRSAASPETHAPASRPRPRTLYERAPPPPDDGSPHSLRAAHRPPKALAKAWASDGPTASPGAQEGSSPSSSFFSSGRWKRSAAGRRRSARYLETR